LLWGAAQQRLSVQQLQQLLLATVTTTPPTREAAAGNILQLHCTPAPTIANAVQAIMMLPQCATAKHHPIHSTLQRHCRITIVGQSSNHIPLLLPHPQSHGTALAI
jgi:hypothetical protein